MCQEYTHPCPKVMRYLPRMLKVKVKRAARIVSGAIRGTPDNLLYEELSWEPLDNRRARNKLFLFHKMVHKQAPKYLVESVPKQVKNKSRYPFHNWEDIDPGSFTSETFKKSYIPSTAKEWNKLDISIHDINILESFKSHFMAFLPRPKLL